jgi:hypothetical protein
MSKYEILHKNRTKWDLEVIHELQTKAGSMYNTPKKCVFDEVGITHLFY